MPAAATTLQSRKQQLVRDAIWDAAIDLFAEKGFDETTVDDIAERAGVSRRSFFRYFGSKDDLLGQGMATYGEALSEAVRACPATYTPLEVVRETALVIARGAAAQPRTRTIIEIAERNAAARAAQLSRRPEVEDQVAAAFASRARRATKADVTPRLLAALTLSILDVAFRSWYEHDQRDISASVEKVTAALAGIVEGRTESKPRR